ncbi:phytanoyl-CoA dioxygenase family protein [Neptuniibacter sp. PT34_22]|uniref:phytanoyl-CoA dioxygenase family protein n=1 Tax=Neptuniibacter sp. PT34_22 TaxID=3398205 RepID=UPI0039F50564
MSALEQGYVLIDEFVSPKQVRSVYEEINAIDLPANAAGIRNADKKFGSIRELALSQILIGKAQEFLPGKPSLVRAILFNKTTENNWLVTWHQDKTVAVSDRFEAEGWGPWSIKDGVHHVQPPIAVLEQMVTFRIHLDDTDENNGCLKVLPVSHSNGVISQSDINKMVQSEEPVICVAKARSALVMRPHILHASSKATEPSQRRVLHLEYSSFTLPNGIHWA